MPNFNQWFPFFIRYSASSGTYGLFDSTGVPAGNPAETLEFRAIATLDTLGAARHTAHENVLAVGSADNRRLPDGQ